MVVENTDLREQLKPYSRDQAQVTDASHLIVLCRRTDMGTDSINKFVAKTAEVRGIPLESLDEYKKLMLGFVEGKSDEEVAEWLTNQVYIAQ